MPEFSVIVATRARPDLLRVALASVQAQTITDFECIVIDDGSFTARDVMPDDPRFRLIEQSDPAGVSVSRNLGAAEAQGAAICFLDDDDRYLPNRLELARQGLEQAAISLCWSEIIDAGGAVIRSGSSRSAPPGRTLDGDVRDVLFDSTLPHLGVTTVARSTFLPFDAEYLASGDLEWWLRMREVPVATVPVVGYQWRQHGGLRQGNPPEARIAAVKQLLADHADYFGTHRSARAFRFYRIGMIYLQGSQRRQAASWLLRSLLTRPRLGTLAGLARVIGVPL